MAAWENFEIEATAFLNNKFGTLAKFEHLGGSDSNVSDILVKDSKHGLYYIEAKCCPAQCGQFVLLPNIKNRTFDYSEKNLNKINSYARRIIDYMNNDFDGFKEAGTAGKDIEFSSCEKIFADWVIDSYRKKGARFIITNGFMVFELEDLLSFFNITAQYRVKRSGSSDVGWANYISVTRYLTENYSVSNIEREDGKLFITTKDYLRNKRFILGGREYMFSDKGRRYEIRRLSNTFNANVIFSVELKNNVKGLSYSELCKLL